jgi:hypothetical protein
MPLSVKVLPGPMSKEEAEKEETIVGMRRRPSGETKTKRRRLIDGLPMKPSDSLTKHKM